MFLCAKDYCHEFWFRLTRLNSLNVLFIYYYYYYYYFSSSSLLSLIFEIFDLMLSDWVSFLAYPNLFGIKGFVVVVVVV
jgi:hypothetical protein